MIEHTAPRLTPRSDSVLFRELRGGPGALMFDSPRGSHTRIRRTPVRAVAALSDRTGRLDAFAQIVNLSPGGCYLKADVELEEGAEIIMRVTILGSARTRARVRAVVLRRERSDGYPAYGVGFVAHSAEERQALEWLYGRAVTQNVR